MAKDVKFNIRLNIDGKDQIVTATTTVKDLQHTVSAARGESEKFNQSLLNWTNIRAVTDGLQNSLHSIYSAMSDMSEAYAQQQEAETKLATVMRERMNASDAEIESVKNLASAQQQLGVIGDEVQLAGAQQVATFLTEKQSIETLLPAMNNLLAQQKGLNATSTDAVSIGNLVGKAMQGQTSALTRVGITFDEAQKQVMQYGTESERAAMLAEIITQNVGDMNANLAATDSGKMKQLSNTLGDVKEQMGKMARTAMPYVAMASQATTAAVGVGKLYASVCGLSTAMGITKASILSVPGPLKNLGVSLAACGVSARTSALAVKALNIALKSTLAGLGISVAVMTLGKALDYLTGSADSATNALEKNDKATQDIADSEQEFARKSGEVKATLDQESSRLKTLMERKQATATAVRHLNDEYGDIFGQHKTAAEWYDVLTKKSKAYAMQLGYEAQAKMLASKIAETQMSLEENYDQRKQLWKDGEATKTYNTSAWVDQDGRVHEATKSTVATDKLKDLRGEGAELIAKRKALEAQLDRALKGADKWAQQITLPTKTAPTKTTPAATDKKTYTGTTTPTKADDPLVGLIETQEARINELRKQLAKATDEGTVTAINKQITAEEAELDRLRNLGKDMGKTVNEAVTEEVKPVEIEIDTRSLGEQLQDVWSNVKGIGDSVQSLTEALRGNMNAWQTLCTVIDSTIGIAQGIQAITQVTQALGLVSTATTTSKTAESAAVGASTTATIANTTAQEVAAAMAAPAIVANKALTASYAELAAAEYMAAHAYIPFAGFGIGSGFAVSAKALITAMGATPFANGGIVSGPTLAMVGEYSGAGNNPEVIAPLDKLRSMIKTDEGLVGRVTFKIDGRALVGILEKENRITSRG